MLLSRKRLYRLETWLGGLHDVDMVVIVGGEINTDEGGSFLALLFRVLARIEPFSMLIGMVA
jgi:hypothetical protein